MLDMQRIFHTGIVVDDLRQAMREIGESMNLQWTEVRRFEPLKFWTPDRGQQEIVVEAVYSRQGPHHLEIVQGPKGGFYDPSIAPDGRHIGVWVDDLRAEADRLAAQGWKIHAASVSPEEGYGSIAYMSPPTAGFVVELCSIAIKPAIDEWLRS